MVVFVELLKFLLFIIFVVLFVIFLLIFNLLCMKNVKYLLIIKGWIFWFGCVIEFGKVLLIFIKEFSEKYGEVFIFYVIG